MAAPADLAVVVFIDRIRYEGWIKAVLAFSVLLLVGLAVLFGLDAGGRDLFPGEAAAESRLAAVVLWASAAFVLIVYALVLPRRISVMTDGIRIEFLPFRWKIAFESIASVAPSKRMFVGWGFSAITSYGCRIEIARKNGWDVLICPAQRDRFVEEANRALEAWRRSR